MLTSSNVSSYLYVTNHQLDLIYSWTYTLKLSKKEKQIPVFYNTSVLNFFFFA